MVGGVGVTASGAQLLFSGIEEQAVEEERWLRGGLVEESGKRASKRRGKTDVGWGHSCK